MPLISIIVPAYNPGEHFGDCLRSIAVQSFRDYEVIIIDDGSLDSVDPAFVAGCGLSEDLATVVRTENHGPYAARRRGVAEAHGAYLMNVDADDGLIGTEALAKIAAALNLTHADMLLVNASCREDGSSPLVDYSGLGPEVRLGETVLFDPAVFRNLFATDYIYNSTWTKVVRRDCVDGLSEPCPRIVMAEDRMLDMDFLPGVQSSAVLDEPLYYYRPSEASITRSGYKPDYYLQVCAVEERVLGWLDAVGFDEEAWAENFLRVTCNALLGFAYNRDISFSELEDAFEMVCEQGPYCRAVSAGAVNRLGNYERAQLMLLQKRRFKVLRAMMLARRLGSRVRSALRDGKLSGGC